jgi:hypothetical protein
MREETGKQIDVPLDKIIIRIEEDKKISTTNFLHLKRGGTVEYAVESAREIIRRRSRSNR